MLRTLGWAVYLAVSWTWCIGMYLPMLLTRDQGLAGFWAFFIPNVLGAASVGWLLSTRERSERFVALTRPIILAFTMVTIGFHGYWIAWRFAEAVGSYELLGGIAGGAVLIALLVLIRRRVDWLPAVVTLVCSLIAGVALLSLPVAVPRGPLDADLAGLAAVCVLGFGLCPYLDVTFQHAAQRARRPRLAFSLGFGVFFAMIILVATRGRAVWSPYAPVIEFDPDLLLAAIGLHFGAQSAFTVLAHGAALPMALASTSETGPPNARPRIRVRFWLVFTAIAAIVSAGLLLIARFVPFEIPPAVTDAVRLPPVEMAKEEIGYRLFLGTYGFIFPAWMLIALRRGRAGDGPALGMLMLTCVVAGPFFLYAAIWGEEAWYIPGVVAAVGIPLLTKRATREERRPA